MTIIWRGVRCRREYHQNDRLEKGGQKGSTVKDPDRASLPSKLPKPISVSFINRVSISPISRRSQQLILFFFILQNKFQISPRRDSNSRTNTSSIRGLLLVHRGDRHEKKKKKHFMIRKKETTLSCTRHQVLLVRVHQVLFLLLRLRVMCTTCVHAWIFFLSFSIPFIIFALLFSPS